MPTLTICVTTDWEGQNLGNANLAAMTLFRQQFPNVPLTHFICPAYLTRGGNLGAISHTILGQILPNDEVALHVHCWQTLVAASNVNPVLQPSWYIQGNGPAVPYGQGQSDVGHGVPLGRYTPAEIGQIVTHANQLLVQNQIAPATPVSFRCGGWMSADGVQQALQAGHVANDSSCTDAPYFTQIDQRLQQFNCRLGSWLPQLWGANALAQPAHLANTLSHAVLPGGGTALTQPYGIQGVLQVPDNGVLADYLTAQMIYDRLHAAWQQAAQADFVHVCGFHQESATTRNLYDNTANLTNLTTALAQFLQDVGVAPAGSVEREELEAARIAPRTAGALEAGNKPQVLFNTVRRIIKKEPGLEGEYVPLDAADRRRVRELIEAEGPAQPEPAGRFWG